MARKYLLLLALLSLLPPGTARGADGWAQLKLGMTAEQAMAVVGAPLFRCEGRGFELWIYDSRAEVVMYGGVIAWTAPAGSTASHGPAEVWEFYQATPNRVKDPVPLRRSAPNLRLQEYTPIPDDSGSSFHYRQRY
jgi:hypothetical protein